MRQSHGRFPPVLNVPDEAREIWQPRLAAKHRLVLVNIQQKQSVADVRTPDVGVLAQLDGAFGSLDEQAKICP